MIFRIILICSVLMCSMGMKVHTELPVADVFELMDEINLVKKDALWPGFYPGEIPTAIFDGINTYLFKHPSPPEAFMVLRKKEEAWVFKGQHGQVRGNSRVQLNGIWTATSVLRTHSRLTGEKYSMQNLAGIIIHEQFHVFQRLKHPDWRPNDGHLFNYPLDTPEMLALRRLETEALRRAVSAQIHEEASGWVKEALRWRDKRHHLLDDVLIQYEGELQRFEGLAEYIECMSGGKDLTRIPVDPGFAPGAIRHLGYLLGRWTAAILDRLDSNWKETMESGQAEYLHEILETTASSSNHTYMFSDEEQKSFLQKAKEAVEDRGNTVQRLRKEFDSQQGYRIEIVSFKTPLNLVMFFADRTEALSQRELLHRFLLMLRNDKCVITVRELMSITENDGSTGVEKLTVAGITEKPLIENIESKIKITAKGFHTEFSKADLEEGQNGIRIVFR
jgi:hypothetical protein